MRWFFAPAKVNLFLHVLGRREDGYHDLESLVAFCRIGDWLGFAPGELELDVQAPPGVAAMLEDNLVLRAAKALAARAPDFLLGKFRLVKRLPIAAGLGGGSADAAAALRALADANRVSPDDERVRAAALETGADVPACLSSKARVMRGVGERLSPPIPLEEIFALLANPREPTSTREVFAQMGLEAGQAIRNANPANALCGLGGNLATLRQASNDLEEPARRLKPVIAAALEELRRCQGARVVRMSGSGSTCFALFDNARQLAAARFDLSRRRPDWWVVGTQLQ